MKKLRIYLDTSVINFLFADDAPEKKLVTIEFFEKFIQTGIHDFFISDVVFAEISATPDIEKRDKLLEVVTKYALEQAPIQFSSDIDILVKTYISKGIFSVNKEADALHVAIATVNQMDILLSWNYRHLANVFRERKIVAENMLMNYTNTFRIITPLELIGGEDE